VVASGKSREDELYDQHRQHLIQSLNDQSGKYDRALFVLSSGAIALSTTYFDKLAGKQALWLPSMWGAWISFALCLSSLVASHWTSSKAIQADIDQLDESYGGANYKWKPSSWNRATETLNLGSLGFFVLGTTLFLLFAFGNLGS
jgi:hypothetical protein